MRTFFKYLSRLFFFLALVIVLYFSIIILTGIFTDYHPKEISELEISGNLEKAQISDSIFTFLSWNIGYGGLGAEMDFFYDGGKMVRPPLKLVEKYTVGILDFFNANDSIDFILLQEVDRKSTRTNFQDELSMLDGILINYSSSFGYNYKVQFIPIPLTRPLGQVEMGQANFSRHKPASSERYTYHSAYSWPKQLFMPDRCFVVSQFNLSNGKELVVINTHNSAYDSEGKLRNIEIPLIRDFMLNEFNQGNYVVAGGDWSQNPPDFKPEKLRTNYQAAKTEMLDEMFFPKGWKICYDEKTPTNRKVDIPLTKGKTEATVIDYFILSPNLDLTEIKTHSLNFQYSDHNPVFLKIRLKN